MALIDEFCAHRGVSLWFGRNEEYGLRCPYHGWKYDVTGQCIDVPSEPAESRLLQEDQAEILSADRARRRAVDLHGPPEQQPPLPEWEFATVPPEQSFISKRLQECNWLQALEGGIDSSHVSFLHRGDLNTDPMFKGAKGNQYNLNDARPFFEVVESPGGLYIGARRNAENGNYYWRITPMGDAVLHHDRRRAAIIRCTATSGSRSTTRTAGPGATTTIRPAPLTRIGGGGDARRQGHSRALHPRHLPADRQQGQRLPDGPRGAEARRDLQRRRRHRHAGRVAAGEHGADRRPHEGEPGLDRQRHHHGAAPPAARAKAMEKGVQPPGIDLAHQRVRSAAVVLPPDQPFKDAAREALIAKPGVAPASV